MLVNVPYISARANRDGSKRFYWVRPGFAARRLPDGESERLAQAIEWNRLADGGEMPAKPRRAPEVSDTLAWYIRQYEDGAPFNALAASTRKNYGRQLALLRETFPTHKIGAFNKKLVKAYLATLSTDPIRRVARNVLLNLFEMAIENEDLVANPASNLRLPGSPKRENLWEPEQIAAFEVACGVELDKSAEMIRTAFSLLVHTGQRPIDVLKMRWDDYDGEFINVVQQKTGAKVEVYCHPALKARLEAVRPLAKGMTIVGLTTGRPCSYNNLRVLMRRVMTRIGADELMTRDLRRTAVTRLYEADCSEGVIASITGHSIEACRRILDSYRVGTRAMTKLGITKLADYQQRRRDESA